jgi:polysaccharide export outer membrane protein
LWVQSVRKRFAIIAALLPLAGCAQGWEQTMPGSAPGGTGITADGAVAEGPEAVSSISELPARGKDGPIQPFGAKGEAAAYEYPAGYRIGAGDRLTIRVAGEADLTNDYLVDGAGNISLPYVRSVSVSGKTAPQIEDAVEAKLRQGFLRDPIVSVQVTTLRPFYIMGEVGSAGAFPYQPGISVQNAIAIAGGYGPRADQDKVLITRKNANGTATFKVPVTTQVYPGDIIYVRERWF